MELHTIADIRAKCRVDEADDDACWIWRYGTDNAGRPRARNGSCAASSVARLVVELDGRRLGSHVVTNKCGEYRCLNPAHLSISTRSTVLRDAYKTGRRDMAAHSVSSRKTALARGMNKITPEQAEAIRAARMAGASRSDLAATYGVAPDTISRITAGKRFALAMRGSSVFTWRP